MNGKLLLKSIIKATFLTGFVALSVVLFKLLNDWASTFSVTELIIFLLVCVVISFTLIIYALEAF